MDEHGSNHDNNDEHQHNIPPTTTRPEAPQLNSTVPGHGGSSGQAASSIGDGEDGGDSDGAYPGFDSGFDLEHDGGYMSDDEDEENDHLYGDEGVGNHQIEIPGYGMVPFRTIFNTIARHENCTCHSTHLRDMYFVPDATTPNGSGMQTPCSTIAEHGSPDHSLASPSMFSSRNASHELLPCIGDWMGNSWLPLLDIDYPTQLSSISEEDGSGYE